MKTKTEKNQNETMRRVQKIFPVVIAAGFHLFPFRTEKLSPPAPMVLHTRGRVGRRLFNRKPRIVFIRFGASSSAMRKIHKYGMQEIYRGQYAIP